MAIRVQHSPNLGLMGLAAAAGGKAQYAKWLREIELQEGAEAARQAAVQTEQAMRASELALRRQALRQEGRRVQRQARAVDVTRGVRTPMDVLSEELASGLLPQIEEGKRAAQEAEKEGFTFSKEQQAELRQLEKASVNVQRTRNLSPDEKIRMLREIQVRRASIIPSEKAINPVEEAQKRMWEDKGGLIWGIDAKGVPKLLYKPEEPDAPKGAVTPENLMELYDKTFSEIMERTGAAPTREAVEAEMRNKLNVIKNILTPTEPFGPPKPALPSNLGRIVGTLGIGDDIWVKYAKDPTRWYNVRTAKSIDDLEIRNRAIKKEEPTEEQLAAYRAAFGEGAAPAPAEVTHAAPAQAERAAPSRELTIIAQNFARDPKGTWAALATTPQMQRELWLARTNVDPTGKPEALDAAFDEYIRRGNPISSNPMIMDALTDKQVDAIRRLLLDLGLYKVWSGKVTQRKPPRHHHNIPQVPSERAAIGR